MMLATVGNIRKPSRKLTASEIIDKPSNVAIDASSDIQTSGDSGPDGSTVALHSGGNNPLIDLSQLAVFKENSKIVNMENFDPPRPEDDPSRIND